VFYSQGKMADVVWKRPKVMKHTKQLAKTFQYIGTGIYF
jgi:hypothetical protein